MAWQFTIPLFFFFFFLPLSSYFLPFLLPNICLLLVDMAALFTHYSFMLWYCHRAAGCLWISDTATVIVSYFVDNRENI
jgi:hypothetical protein